MRVAIVTRIYAPEPAAAAFRLAALASALASRGDRVDVITTSLPSGAAEPPAVAGVAVRRAPVLRDRNGYLRGYLQYLSFDVPAFFRLLFGRRRDVVVVEPPPTTGFVVRLACALRRMPYVAYAPDVWSDAAASTGAPRFVVGGVRWLERRALRGAERIIAVTDGVAERVRALAPGVEVSLVPNGIDTDVFTPDGPTVEDAPWGVYAGTTSEWQGADVFVRAMPAVRRELPDAVIAFVGQGSARAELERLAADLAPGAVRFVDPVPPVEAAALLRSARAGLVSLRPGLGYDFAVPTKILASVASGTPVVFAGPGAGAELVRDAGLGEAVEHDVEAAAAAMVRAFVDAPAPERRHELGGWARANVSAAARAGAAAEIVHVGGER